MTHFSLWREEDGQDLVEYSLLITFVALACISLLGILSAPMTNIWAGNQDTLNRANNVGH